MNTFLIYILESTICISVFYLLFRVLMRKETSFAVNRATLLTIVVASVIVPLVQLPQLMQTPVHVELIPEFSESKVQIQNLPATENATSFEVQQHIGEAATATNELTIPLETLLRYFYLAGVLVALLLFIRNVILIFMLSRKATVQQMDGYRLLIVDREVPSFAFGRSVVISQTDYDAHGSAILAHEQAHIRQNHFVDLLLLELVRTIHWFNPAVYALIGDMKEIHEFQADEQTLHSGIDATQYQLLVIQKGVGPRRFALANSFNHCQIKKRITMMNKSKTSKAWRWKVATFLPLLALLLMAFGNRSEKVPPKESLFTPIISEISQDSVKVWTESDFKVFTKENKEEAFFKNQVLVNFQIDANSKITVDGASLSLAEVSSYVKKWFNYNYAEQREWIHFQKITVNGKTRMLPMSVVTVRKDPAANQSDFLKLLNVVANTVLQIRGDYSQDIYGNLYQKITPAQRKEIDKLIPMKVAVTHAVMISSMIVPPPPRPQIIIQIRKDGNYMDNKLCSLEEIGKKAELLYKKNSNGVASLKVESDVPMSRVTEVKEVLRNSKVLNVNQSIVKTDLSKPSTLPPPQITIQIREDGNYINNKSYTLEGITEKLKALSINNLDKVYYLVDDPMPQNRIDEVKTAVNKVTDNFKKLTPPPPPPPNVIDMGFRITIIKDAFRVNRKSRTLSEIEKMLEDIDPKKEFIQIDTHSTSSKELQSSLKDLLEKKGISYQILWSN